MMAATVTKAAELWNAGQLGAARQELVDFVEENQHRSNWVDDLVDANPPKGLMQLLSIFETEDGEFLLTVSNLPS